MDPIARRKLQDLLATLPSGRERELLVGELVGGGTPASTHTTPERHAQAVVDVLTEQGADLNELFTILRQRHPALQARINVVADQVIEPDVEEAEGPTEMIDPAVLADLRSAGTPQLGGKKNLANLSAPAPAPTPAPAPQPAPAPAPNTPPASTPAPPSGGGISPSLIAGGAVVVLLIVGLAFFTMQ